MLKQRVTGPGGEARIDADTQHCSKTPRTAQIQADGQFKI
jgi:substrate-binding family protein